MVGVLEIAVPEIAVLAITKTQNFTRKFFNIRKSTNCYSYRELGYKSNMEINQEIVEQLVAWLGDAQKVAIKNKTTIFTSMKSSGNTITASYLKHLAERLNIAYATATGYYVHEKEMTRALAFCGFGQGTSYGINMSKKFLKIIEAQEARPNIFVTK